MGTDPRTGFRSLVAVVVLVGAGVGLPARAETRAPVPRTRVAVLPVDPVPARATAGAASDAARSVGEVRLPFRATHVGIRWRGSEDDPVEIRWRGTGDWGDWRRLSIWEDAGDHDLGLVAAGLVRPDPGATRLAVRWSAAATQFEAVVIGAGRTPTAQLFPSTTGGGEGPHRTSSTTGGAPAASTRAAPPEIISRAGWGADEGSRKGAAEFAPISKLIVHHTVTPNDDPDPAQTVRAIYAYHTRHNRWNDIGYNFLVDQQGRVYEGRFARRYRSGEAPSGEDNAGRGVIGAHVKGLNPGTVGVAVLGDYSGGVIPPGPALDGVVRVLAWKAGRHNIDPHGASSFTANNGSRHRFPNISGHRDVGQTGCPGGRLHERLPEIRQRVAEALGAPPASPPPDAAPPPAPVPPPVPEFPGFWAAAADGRVQAFGDVRSVGDLAGKVLAGPIVSLAAAPAGRGYWMAGADGGVFAYGDAAYLGAAAGQIRSPAVHLEPTPTGKGYWVLSAAGEVVPFGDAPFRGQLFPLPVKAVGLAATPTGHGYWIATADGQVFAFGDAVLPTATGSSVPVGAAGGAPPGPTGQMVAIAASPDGTGYWLLGRDGGVFSFGVPFYGSVVDRQPYAKAVELRASDSGQGYYVAGIDGAVFAFGDADPRRERPAGGPDAVVDLAFRPIAPRPAAAASALPATPAPPDAPAPPAAPAPPEAPPAPPEAPPAPPQAPPAPPEAPPAPPEAPPGPPPRPPPPPGAPPARKPAMI